MKKLLRVTTSSLTLDLLLKGQLRFLNQHFEVIGIASGGELLKKVSEREGIRVINVPMHREISIFNDIVSLYIMIRTINIEEPYIIHANSPKGSLLAMLAGKFCRVPHRIYTVTGLRYQTKQGLLKFVLKTTERVCCRLATKVIPEGEGVKNTLINDKITTKPLQKVLNGNINGIDLEYFHRTEEVVCASKNIKKDNHFTFIYVGRLVQDKGMNELLYAFNKLTLTTKDKLKKPHLLLVGWFETKEDPINIDALEILNTNPQIEFAGYQNDIRPYLAASDALVFPSYREGFPNVVMQACAMGLPAIVTDINGSNEIIINGINGVIIPPKDENALYNEMLDFLENETKVKQLSAKGRELIVSRYDQNQVWASLLDVYKNLNNSSC